jgi:hypothetical protein
MLIIFKLKTNELKILLINYLNFAPQIYFLLFLRKVYWNKES